MPVRIYEIAKKLGIENKVVLAKAKELGITAKVASSSLDKITAEFLEEKLGGAKPAEAMSSAPPEPVPEPAPLKIISEPEQTAAPAAREAPRSIVTIITQCVVFRKLRRAQRLEPGGPAPDRHHRQRGAAGAFCPGASAHGGGVGSRT